LTRRASFCELTDALGLRYDWTESRRSGLLQVVANKSSGKTFCRAIAALAGITVGAYLAGFFPGVCDWPNSTLRMSVLAAVGGFLALGFYIATSRSFDISLAENSQRDYVLSLLPLFVLITIPLLIPRFAASLNTYFSSYVERLWPKMFLFGLILAGYLFIRRTVNPSFRERADRFVGRHTRKLLGAIVVLYVVFFLITGLWDFYIFGNWHDLSRFTTAQYSVSQGHFFLSRLHTQSGSQIYELIGDHFAPTKLLILPFFLIFRTAAVFLVFKTVVMGLAAIPFFLLARTRLKALESFLLTLAYLLVPTAIAQNYTGFHPVVFATFLVPFTIYFFELRRFGWFITFMLLCSGLKENVPFIMLLFPALALFQRRPRKWVVTPAVVNVMWLILVFGILFPLFRTADNMMVVRYPYIQSVSDLALETLRNPSIVLGNLAQPQKQEFIFYLFAPFFFLLPFGSVYSLMGLLPAFVVSGLMNWEVPITFHHGILASSFFGPATALTISRVAGSRRRVLSIALSTLILLIAICYIPIWWGTFKMNEDSYFEAQKKALAMIPAIVPATAPRYLLPHLASLNEVYFLGKNALTPGGVEYAIVDTEKITTWWEPAVIDEVKQTGGLVGFDLIWHEGPIHVFKRQPSLKTGGAK